MAWSAGLAGATGMERQTLLVRSPLGAPALLRHHHRWRGAGNAYHRRCRGLRSAAACTEPMLVLGGSIRQPRLLGLLFVGLNERNSRRASADDGQLSAASPGQALWRIRVT